MKKQLILAAIAALGLSACQNDETVVDNVSTPDSIEQTQGYEYTFSASIDVDKSLSKVPAIPIPSIAFAKGDRIYVKQNGEKAVAFSCNQVSADGKSFSFTGFFNSPISDNDEIVAYYGNYNATTDRFTIANDQSTKTEFEKKSLVMSAKTTGKDMTLNFTILNSFIAFEVPYDLFQLSISTNGDEKISGSAYINSDGLLTVDATATNNANVIGMLNNPNLSTSVEAGKTYYFSIIPTNFSKGYYFYCEKLDDHSSANYRDVTQRSIEPGKVYLINKWSDLDFE